MDSNGYTGEARMETLEQHYCNNPAAFPLGEMFKRGKGRGARVLIVGQSPASNGWRETGVAFHTRDEGTLPTGENLDELLRLLDLSLEECAYTDLVKCYRGKNSRGKDRGVRKSCVRGCWPIFEQQLDTGDFGLLILLGQVVLDAFIDETQWPLFRGRLSSVVLSGAQYEVLPIYHTLHRYQGSARENLRTFEKLGDELRTLLVKLQDSSSAGTSG